MPADDAGAGAGAGAGEICQGQFSK
jgi:hypothetical protein